MHKPRLYQILFSLLGCALLFLLAACGSSASTPGKGSTPTSTSTTVTPTTTTSNTTPTTPSGTPPGVTVSMPPTQTSCPPAGVARAAVMARLALGSHPNIVYIVNGPTHLGTLKRYDVTTGAKTEIVNLANTNISSAQLSANGQWILFVAISGRQAKLQLIRVDGQGLQTLLCATAAPNGANPTSAIDHTQWATNQQLVIFNNYTVQGDNLYLLNVQSGSLQREFSSGSSAAYEPATWLDNTRVYLFGPTIDAPSGQLYILDTSRGPNQTINNLQLAYNASKTNPSCWSFDSSYDGAKLFTSTCFTTPNPNGPGIGSMQGPSDISSQPAAGGSSTFVYQNQTLAITTVRDISNSTLLFLGANTNSNTGQNGLWKIGTNGSNPVRLTSAPGTLNQFSQFPWSNVSRDSSMYVMQSFNSGSHISAMFFGPLNGGSPTTFATISDGTILDTVGWTTM
jgi:hypothetical protein